MLMLIREHTPERVVYRIQGFASLRQAEAAMELLSQKGESLHWYQSYSIEWHVVQISVVSRTGRLQSPRGFDVTATIEGQNEPVGMRADLSELAYTW